MPNKKMRDPTIRIFVAVFNFTQTFPQTYIFPPYNHYRQNRSTELIKNVVSDHGELSVETPYPEF